MTAETRLSTDETARLEDLSVYELVAGILLQLGARKFPEQALLQLFQGLQSAASAEKRHFGVKGSPGRLTSEPLQQALSFLEMYKILEVAPPNPVEQYYRLRPGMMTALRDDLTRRGVLPGREAPLTRLASRLSAIITEAPPAA